MTHVRKEHVADHQRFFRRMSLELPVDEAVRALPTDERLRRVQDGATDEDLVALYFQYRTIPAHRQQPPREYGSEPPGQVERQLAPAWGSKYTININTEMNYWPAEITNLSELHEPLFDLD